MNQGLPRWPRGRVHLPLREMRVRSLGEVPGRGNGKPPQYSCLGNPMHRGAWRATEHGVAELNTTEQLSTQGCTN